MHNLDIFLPEAGFLALLLSLGVNVLTPLATWCGMGLHWRGVMRLTTCGAWTAFTLLLLAFAILVSCFLTSVLIHLKYEKNREDIGLFGI